ncbi:MAG: hypothetical protein PHH85_03890 [Candidatus Methanoperedens sp.]|nr:hypothetical protein [Candidatus Methanoperedens sp.]
MRRYFVILFVFILGVNQASAVIFNPDDIEWASAVSGTLHKGGTLTNGEYMVKAAQFPAGVPGIKTINGDIVPETDVDPMVYLEIYKNGMLLKEFVMTVGGEAYIDPDYEVKVSATSFSARNAKEWVLEFFDPWAAVSIQKRALPKLEVTVTTDKSTYTSNNAEIITATVNVKNTGDAFSKNIDATLNIGELKLRGGDASQLHNSYLRLNKGESKSFDVILVVPDLIDQKSYSLSASVKGYDVKELGYNASGSLSLTVSPKQNYFGISKAVRDRIYLQDYATVRITIANGGMYDIYNIHVTDNMSDKFVLSSSPTPFAWDIPLLKPGEEWGTGYSIKPTEANIDGWTIPVASATFTVNNKPYSASSSTMKIVVNGPRLQLNKTVSKPVVNLSEDVTVTVSVNNIGNIGIKTDVKDSLPDDVSLVSGQLSQLNFSEPGKAWGFSYIIRMNKEGVYELPSAIANYTNVEYRGFVRDVKSSERPIIKVIDPNKPTPAPTEQSSQTQVSPQGNPGASQENPASSQRTPGAFQQLFGDSSNISSTSTPEPTPTPITPGFDIAFAVIVLIFTAVFRRR